MHCSWLLYALVVLATGSSIAESDANPAWQLNAEIKADIQTPARTAFLRSESPQIVLSINTTGPASRLHGEVLLKERDTTIWRRPWSVAQPGSGTNLVMLSIPLSKWRVGEYGVEITAGHDSATVITNINLQICPKPDRAGFPFAMLDEKIREGPDLNGHLEELKKSGFNGVMAYQPIAELWERCLWYGMNGMSILNGHNQGGEPRLNASGKPFDYDPAKPGSGRWGIARPEWQVMVASNIGNAAGKWSLYPGYYPIINTSDDFYRWTGLDYHQTNVMGFEQKYRIPPPRPSESLTADFPAQVSRPCGIIPDDDPWVLWLKFNAESVLGKFNKRMADDVRHATGETGKIGPVCGGGPYPLGTVPLVDMPSGQWPPYNFGINGFSLISYYNYNCYYFPAVAQVWWAELARMGNRDMPVWLMPDTMDLRLSYHLQNLYLFLAGNVDSIVYFIYDYASPASREALGRVGPKIHRLQNLLADLKPVQRPIGLLMPFESACFKSSFPADVSYAFANLVMAHAEVEPVWPEELDQRANRYKAILLHEVGWLTEANKDRLERYRRSGGRVIADTATQVNWSGVERLDFSLATHERHGGYGNTNLIAKIRNVTESIVEPWARSDNPHLLLRHFRSAGTDYLWVVHLMNQAEDAKQGPPATGQEFKSPMLDEFKNFDQRHVSALITTKAGTNSFVYDVLNSQAITTTHSSPAGLAVNLHVPYWQGMLLVFHPVKPDAIKIKMAKSVVRGKSAQATILIQTAEGRRVPMSLPLEIDVLQPDGSLQREFSRTALAKKGKWLIELPLADNEAAGTWTLRVKEQTTGLSAEAQFVVRND